MPKILGHKTFNIIMDKGAHARNYTFTVEGFYDLHEKDTEESKLLKQRAKNMEDILPCAGMTYLFGEYAVTLTPHEASLDKEKIRLLILEAIDKEREKFERLRRKFSGDKAERGEIKREPISEEVRIMVWRRDGGVCVKCGSRENLEYDHIVPISKGGSNTARNIELLCEKCNREKKDNIG